MTRDPSRPNPNKRKAGAAPQQEYRRPKKHRKPQPQGGTTMTQKTAQQKKRTTPRTPSTRTVYEVAQRQDGKPGRPMMTEAKTPQELAGTLADLLRLDEPTSRAAALLLSQGATITSDTWQGRPVGRMVFTPLTEAAPAAAPAGQAPDDDQPQGDQAQRRPASSPGEGQPWSADEDEQNS